MARQQPFDLETEVLIVGYGGAGAVAAVAAHDAGAKVLVLEKQPSDTPTKTNHTPSTRLCGGAWFSPTDPDRASLYMQGMVGIANETLDEERKAGISAFAHTLVSNTDWMKSIGVQVLDEATLRSIVTPLYGPGTKVAGQTVLYASYPSLPGSDCTTSHLTKADGKYRNGAALFKSLVQAVQKRSIQVLWESPAVHLLTEGGEVRGAVALSKGKDTRIKASKGVILTCGGFEFNNPMKKNYLRVNPVHFAGNPANTGDGVNMAMEIGASLWHMNDASWRSSIKIPGYPCGFSTQRHETASFFVDKRGRRFTNERCKMHGVGYELTGYDCYAMTYPRVPFYWIFGETRRKLAPLASYHGICNPPGGVTGDIYYVWSEDNQKEIDKGWIIRANTIEELAGKILAEPDNNGLMSGNTLKATLEQYNRFCDKGCDDEFRKAKEWLQPVDGPPYYAVKLWPGGPNTEGGPKRNVNGQCPGGPSGPIPR